MWSLKRAKHKTKKVTYDYGSEQYKAVTEGYPSVWAGYLQDKTDKGSLMSLRLAVPQEDTLVALPKAKVRVT